MSSKTWRYGAQYTTSEAVVKVWLAARFAVQRVEYVGGAWCVIVEK